MSLTGVVYDFTSVFCVANTVYSLLTVQKLLLKISHEKGSIRKIT